MTSHRAARWPWLLWLLSIALVTASLVLLVLTWPTPVPQDWGFRGSGAVWAIPYATVGALIASRRPGHRIGWLLCAGGLLAALWTFASEYAIVALLARPGALPGGTLAAWIGSWLWVPFLALINAFLVLQFPTGRLLSPRWRVIAWLSVAWVVLLWLRFAFRSGPLWNYAYVDNPFGVPSLAGVLDLLGDLSTALGLGATAFAAISVSLRFRRSRGDERQQLKWFVYAATLVILLQPLSIASLATPLVIATQIALPVAVGIAILKYRLYDIDLLIRRSLAYALLSATLVLVYLGSVLVFQSIFDAFIADGNTLAVTVSTLAIAAVFHPLRRRIQALIDRTFYRRKYDAARVLATFGVALREDVQLDRLANALLDVIDETMQPRSVTLWLRTPASNPVRKP